MRHGYDYENPFAARYPTRKYNDPVGYAAESATPSPRVTAKDSSTSSAISWETTTPLHPNSRLSGDINGYYDSVRSATLKLDSDVTVLNRRVT